MARRPLVLAGIAPAAVLAVFAAAGPVAAAGATIRIDPASQTVAQGGTITVHVIESYSATTSGVEVTVVFDQTQLQMQSVQRGAPYADAGMVAPSDVAGAIAAANSNGQLSSVMAAFMPPTVLPAGDQDFLDITFKATGCGQTTIRLPLTGDAILKVIDGRGGDGASVLDPNGNPIGQVQTSAGSITINNCGGGAQPTAQGTDQGAAAPTQDTAGSTQGSGDASATQAAASSGAAQDGAANPGNQGNQGGSSAGLTSNPGSPAGPSLPLWLPVALAIPAVAIISLGLRRWRLAEIE